MTERTNELLEKLEKLSSRTRDQIRAEDYYQFDDPARGWMIQGVILDEIASQKRKWRIGTAVSYPEDDPIRWQIDLWPDYEHCYWGAGESFAEAILAAYIRALEAEAAHESE